MAVGKSRVASAMADSGYGAGIIDDVRGSLNHRIGERRLGLLILVGLLHSRLEHYYARSLHDRIGERRICSVLLSFEGSKTVSYALRITIKMISLCFGI